MELEEKVKYFVEEISDLKIYEFLEHMPFLPIVEHFDFTTIGLRTETPIYGKKGVKQSSSYTYKGSEIVRKTFVYEENGVWVLFHWFDLNGEVGLEKVIFKPLNIVEVAKINKSNRDRTITYLQASAIGTPIEDMVNDILKRYKTEVDLFIYNDTEDFKISLDTEPVISSNSDYNTILSENGYINRYWYYLNKVIIQAPSDNYPEGKTVKDSILEQII